MQIFSQNRKSSRFFWANPEDLSAQEHIMVLHIHLTNLCYTIRCEKSSAELCQPCPRRKIMKKKYFINNSAQYNGDHEVHVEGCKWLSMAQDVAYLGEFESVSDALVVAKMLYDKADGCFFCCYSAHES